MPLYRESEPRLAIRRLAEQLNVHAEALRNWIRQAESNHGERDDRPSPSMLEENPATGKGERRTAPCQRCGERVSRVRDRPDPESVMRFIDAHDFPVGLILRVLEIATFELRLAPRWSPASTRPRPGRPAIGVPAMRLEIAA